MTRTSVTMRGAAVKVSVYLAAYNAQRTIDEAIRSVLAQTGVTFELLIGDDASADGTWARIAAYRTDPRVRAWRFRVHRGPAAVWNQLIACARGPYLSICDADDVMLPGHLAAASRFLDRFPSVGVACADWCYLNERGAQAPSRREVMSPEDTWDLIRMGGSHGGAMFRREALAQVGGYRGELGYAEAYDLFLRLAEITEIAMLPGKPRYARRVHRPHPGTYRPSLHLERLAIRDAIFRRYGVTITWWPAGSHRGPGSVALAEKRSTWRQYRAALVQRGAEPGVDRPGGEALRPPWRAGAGRRPASQTPHRG